MKVGMMRNGVLLAEDAPNSLMERLQFTSLEDVFLSLCRQDGDTEDRSLSSLDTVTSLPPK
jgi:hypothetical protein